MCLKKVSYDILGLKYSVLLTAAIMFSLMYGVILCEQIDRSISEKWTAVIDPSPLSRILYDWRKYSRFNS